MVRKTIIEKVKELNIAKYDICFQMGENEIGVLPCEYLAHEMALNPVNMVFHAMQLFPSKKRYMFYVNGLSNTHYIALMFKLIGEYTQFQIGERAQ